MYQTNPLFVSKEECALNKRNTRDFLTFLGFILPGFIIYIFIVAYPIFYSILLSFSDYNPNIGGKWNFMGLTHYKTMISDPDFWHAFKNNMIVVAVSVFGQIPIGFILAFILYRKQVKGANFFSIHGIPAAVFVYDRYWYNVENAVYGRRSCCPYNAVFFK